MDIERKRGDTYADEFTLTLKETWEPANLTGSSATLTVFDGATQKYQLTGVVQALAGKILCSPTALQADLKGNFTYSLKLIDATGKIRTIANGSYIYK